MIPKIIHYCWFGHNPLPPLALECIASWRKNFPDYEIKEWNEDNFDVNIIPYTKEAYEAKKYAFVSDYARFWILYNYGGIYFDTDVEVIKPMDDILEKGAFMGFERDPDRWGRGFVAPGLGFAVEKKHVIIKNIMELYHDLSFILPNGKLNMEQNIVQYTTTILENKGLKPIRGIQNVLGITIYPAEYFAPIHFITGRLHITDNTRTIHRYMASWTEQKGVCCIKAIKHYMPEFLLLWYNRIKKIIT